MHVRIIHLRISHKEMRENLLSAVYCVARQTDKAYAALTYGAPKIMVATQLSAFGLLYQIDIFSSPSTWSTYNFVDKIWRKLK